MWDMEKLEKIVGIYIDNEYKGKDLELDKRLEDSTLSDDCIRDAIKEEIKQRIINEVVAEKKKELDQYAKQKIADEKTKSHISTIKQLLWEGFVVAIFVGLLGSELSSLIERGKNIVANGKLYDLITIILIVIFAIIILGLYITKFTKDIINTFTRKGNKTP